MEHDRMRTRAWVLHPEIKSDEQRRVPEPALEEAVALAAELAEPGDLVLLSPACASFDMFSGFVARGRAFAAAVRKLGCTA